MWKSSCCCSRHDQKRVRELIVPNVVDRAYLYKLATGLGGREWGACDKEAKDYAKCLRDYVDP